ncbi:MAG: hypothetical protein QOF97_1311, partial [Acidimicrobiaceae bacterium]
MRGRVPLVVVIALALTMATSACGARLDDQQRAAVNTRGNTGGQAAAAPSAGARTSVPNAASTGPAVTAAADTSGPAVDAAAAPNPGDAAAAPQAGAACAPTGGNLDVGITDSSVTIGSV